MSVWMKHTHSLNSAITLELLSSLWAISSCIWFPTRQKNLQFWASLPLLILTQFIQLCKSWRFKRWYVLLAAWTRTSSSLWAVKEARISTNHWFAISITRSSWSAAASLSTHALARWWTKFSITSIIPSAIWWPSITEDSPTNRRHKVWRNLEMEEFG